MKWIMSTVVAIACAMGVYLMATGLPEKPQDEAAGLKEGQELLKITATNWSFDKEEYVVKAGTDYKVKFANKLGKHGIEIEGVETVLDEKNPEMEYIFDTPGEYLIKCNILCGTGHDLMVAKLIVQ